MAMDVTSNTPGPPSERRAWLLAIVTCAAGIAVLLVVLLGGVGRTSVAAQAPPRIAVAAPTPAPVSPASFASVASTAGVHTSVADATPSIVSSPTIAQQRAEVARLTGAPRAHIARRWMEGFYPIYETAETTFGVNWLLIASIHMQESAFSTAPGIYSGLNFAHCCGGPMQFNVTNGGHGRLSTWNLVSDSYIYGKRPAVYDHMTRGHPSIYDDFDAIMAASHLLSADGAGYELDSSAWNAAYDYYGHDATGVAYADEVLARAIGWSQHGFCINCGVSAGLVQAVHAAYGAPVLAALEASSEAAAKPRASVSRAHSH
jgi:hypothetical protein